MLPHEPTRVELRAGQRVLVDDYTCPTGQVKEVTGGSNASVRHGAILPGPPRQVRCIASEPPLA